jgi:hypothetical protein
MANAFPAVCPLGRRLHGVNKPMTINRKRNLPVHLFIRTYKERVHAGRLHDARHVARAGFIKSIFLQIFYLEISKGYKEPTVMTTLKKFIPHTASSIRSATSEQFKDQAPFSLSHQRACQAVRLRLSLFLAFLTAARISPILKGFAIKSYAPLMSDSLAVSIVA